eukprot:5086654-Prymnesium_polylepis.1
MLRDRLAAVRGTDGRVCGKRHFLRFVAFYVMLHAFRRSVQSLVSTANKKVRARLQSVSCNAH